jgi:hypothetical protein
VPGVDDADGKRIAGDVLKRLATRGELVASESVMHQRRLLGDGGASVSNGRRAMPVAGDSRVGLREESFVGESNSSMFFVGGEEFQVNTYTDNDQQYPSVTALNNGFVVIWESDYQDGSEDGVYGQLYDANGGRVGTEFRVNTHTEGGQGSPSVTALNDGFVVTWTSGDIYGQLYDGNGSRVGTEFRVNTYTNDSQWHPSVTALNDGFVVTWSSRGQDSSYSAGVYGQLYDRNGGRVGTEFQVNTYTDNDQKYPSVTALKDGFVVTWESDGQDGSRDGVYGQLYDANGGRVGTEFQVNTYTDSSQSNPSVTALKDGFVVTWMSGWHYGSVQDGSYYGVYGQLYDSNGGRVGTEFRVNTYTEGYQSDPSVTALNDGFVVTWMSRWFVGNVQDGSYYGVYGQLYDSNGGRVGTEFRVNTYTYNWQQNPSVAALNDGFVVTWESNNQDGHVYGIYAKKYRHRPYGITFDRQTINENIRVGDTIVNLGMTASGTYTYTLVSGEGDTHNTFFEINGEHLVLSQPLTTEVGTDLSIRIRCTNADGLQIEKIVGINVVRMLATTPSPTPSGSTPSPTPIGNTSLVVVGEPNSNMVFVGGEEFKVNTYRRSEQTYPSVAALNDGFVVTWESYYQDGFRDGVYGQLYDGNGGRVGREFQVNTYTYYEQSSPSVTALKDGFVVTWTSGDSQDSMDGQDGSGHGVYGQLYDVNGGRVGTEFQVNTYTSGSQWGPSVTALNDGFVVTWSSDGQDGSEAGVYGQLYNGNGGRVGTEFQVNTYTSGFRGYPSVTALNDGFVVTWSSDGQDGSKYGVYGQLYDANGVRVGTEFQVNTYTDGYQGGPSVAALNDGFVVTWQSGDWSSDGQDGSQAGVYGQLYDGNGGRVGTEFQVNTYTDGSQGSPSVAALNDGFVVTWQSGDWSSDAQDGSQAGVYGQLYDGNGGRVGTEFQVNTYTEDDQWGPSVTALNDGFVVTWMSSYQDDGSYNSIYAKKYCRQYGITFDHQTINENAAVGDTIVNLGMTVSGTYTYTLVSGDGDTHNTFFEINGEHLVLSQPLTTEAGTDLSIRIRCTNADGLQIEKTVGINVVRMVATTPSPTPKVNTAPVVKAQIPSQQYTIDGETSVFTFLVRDYFDDADGDALALEFRINGERIEDGTHSWLQIAYLDASGTIQLTANPAKANAGEYTISVSASDGESRVEQSFSFTVLEAGEIHGDVDGDVDGEGTNTSLSMGAVGGIVAGGVAALALAIGVCFKCYQTRSTTSVEMGQMGPSQVEEPPTAPPSSEI